jgi:hypothetical protein
MAGLSGIGLSAGADGKVYLLGGNVVAEREDAGAADAGGGGDARGSGFMDPEMMEMEMMSQGTSSCDTASTSSTTYDYANFYKFDPSTEPIALTALTATSSDAENMCPPNSDVCRQYFGPAPSTSFKIASQAATGWLISCNQSMMKSLETLSHPSLFGSTGMLLLLHPETGDWWQCNVNAVPARWTRSNGIVEGRSKEVSLNTLSRIPL